MVVEDVVHEGNQETTTVERDSDDLLPTSVL